MSLPSYADPPFAYPPDKAASLNRVLLNAALRAERVLADREADRRAAETAKQLSEGA